MGWVGLSKFQSIGRSIDPARSQRKPHAPISPGGRTVRINLPGSRVPSANMSTCVILPLWRVNSRKPAKRKI